MYRIYVNKLCNIIILVKKKLNLWKEKEILTAS